MADILKVTAPMVSKNVIQTNKAAQDPSVPFDLQEISHIVRNNQSSELLGQHNVYQNETGSAVLMNLLKDPDVTVNYLKNIYMLEEIINLLPVNNNTVTQEIQQLFQSLLIHPEQIVEELMRQEFSSTLFKGELFDFLRGMLHENLGIRREIAELLKAMNGILSRQDVLDSVANNLDFLSDQLTGSSALSAKLAQLAARARYPLEDGEFQALKQNIQQVLKEVEGSILYSPQMEKVVPIIIYNLSRYQDNPQCLNEALLNVLVHVNGRENKEELKALVFDYLERYQNGEAVENRSRIMSVLAKIIGKQDQETDITSLNGDKIEKIIISLLYSPCNYTPLLHFVIPLSYHDMTAFSELWVDPNDYQETKEGTQRGIHVLITFDIEGIGQFEAEFWMAGDSLKFYLFCPKEYHKVFSGLYGTFEKIIQEHGYHLSEIKIDRMEKTRSLMDVFKTLPYKRTGVDVKI